jgi:flotillin
MPVIMLLLVAGIALIAGPIAAGAAGINLGAGASIIMTVSGIGMVLFAGILLTITKLYVKTKASEAFVRTGMGGMKVIKDGGSLVIPVIHQIVRVTLQTIRLEVSREGGENSMFTQDKLRADIRAEFFVRVQPDDDAIKNAARSFGDQMMVAEHVKKLIEDKLVSALRTVAATKTLEQLNSERDEFMKQVTQLITPDLAHNGLTLETATISKLDQTDPKTLRDDNIFDAQGKRTIAEITQKQLTERNQLERAGEQARTAQDVETRKRILELEQQKAEAEAAQAAEVAKVRADNERSAKEKQIEAERQVELANVEKHKQLEVAQRQQQQAAEVAERNKLKAVTEAEQQVEVAKRKQQEAIAEAERQRAAKEAELAKAEADRERERQAIKTVEVEAAAERDKRKRVIEAEAAAQEQYVKAEKAADAEAYTMKARADGQKAAAEAEAEAITRRAQADADAAQARATGQKAEQMVPVDVERERVSVEQQRVDVLRQELEAKEKHGKVGLDFEIAKLEVTKRAEVQIAAAGACAQLFGSINATLFGNPEDLAKMTQRYMQGMGIANAANGFLEGADNGTRDAVDGVAGQLAAFVSAAAKKLGMDPPAFTAQVTDGKAEAAPAVPSTAAAAPQSKPSKAAKAAEGAGSGE